jgi:hypothetical protein
VIPTRPGIGHNSAVVLQYDGLRCVVMHVEPLHLRAVVGRTFNDTPYRRPVKDVAPDAGGVSGVDGAAFHAGLVEVDEAQWHAAGREKTILID